MAGSLQRAYRNRKFINSVDARPLRILAEYLEPAARFRSFNIRDTIVFFGSARSRAVPEAQQALTQLEREGAPEREMRRAQKTLELAKYGECATELARRLTLWSKGLNDHQRRFVICSGGGPGIMEAANKGASDAKGENIGLRVSLPDEQSANRYITRRLAFEFHYFFMRKLWFVYLAKGMVVFPGGFGTLDELTEVLTLIQTRKVTKPIPLVIFGRSYWEEVLNIDAMVEWGTIGEEDKDLFKMVETVDEAYDFLTSELTRHYLVGDTDADDEPRMPALSPDQ